MLSPTSITNYSGIGAAYFCIDFGRLRPVYRNKWLIEKIAQTTGGHPWYRPPSDFSFRQFEPVTGCGR